MVYQSTLGVWQYVLVLSMINGAGCGAATDVMLPGMPHLYKPTEFDIAKTGLQLSTVHFLGVESSIRKVKYIVLHPFYE